MKQYIAGTQTASCSLSEFYIDYSIYDFICLSHCKTTYQIEQVQSSHNIHGKL